MTTHAATESVRVCFHRPHAYGVFYPHSCAPVGGAEIRSHRFAVALAQRAGFEVSFLLESHGQLAMEVHGPVTTIRTSARAADRLLQLFTFAYREYRECVEPQQGFPWVRFRRWRLGLVWQIPLLVVYHLFLRQVIRQLSFLPPRAKPFYARLGCAVFCCFGANENTADIVATCRADPRRMAKAVVFLINQEEVSDAVSAKAGFVATLGTTGHNAWYSLAHADHIVAQTEWQAERIRARYDTPVTVIRNPIELGLRPPMDRPPGAYALWIGRADPPEGNYKRVELLPTLARLCPEVPFRAVVNPCDLGAFERLTADLPPNLTVVKRVSYEEADSLIAGAAVLLNTSVSEGFPNTFLQAARHEVPVLSLRVDPDGMLSRAGAGISCGDDLELMAANLHRLYASPAEARRLGEQGRAYVEKEHDLEACVDTLAELLRQVVASPCVDGGR